jgi:uncharacterized protein YggT (Ycf19 family)
MKVTTLRQLNTTKLTSRPATTPRLVYHHCRPSTSTIQCSAAAAAAAPSPPQQPQKPSNNLVLRIATTMKSTIQIFNSSLDKLVQQTNSDATNTQIRESLKHMQLLLLLAPFAAIGSRADTAIILVKSLAQFIKLYLLLLFVKVILSWFPTIGPDVWEQQPLATLNQITNPYLRIFNGLVPSLLGTIDLTPLFGFMILQYMAATLNGFAAYGDPFGEYWG